MDQQTREKLESKGWKVGTASDFLELSPEEITLIKIRLELSRSLKQRRQTVRTQAELAENEDDSVSIERLIHAILATGASPQDIAQVIASVR